MSTLYIVATPIGNLGDISYRALDTMRQVKWIAAEDTRQTKKLLNHYDIQTPLVSFHEHSKQDRIKLLLARLEESDLALVSDAGTPLLNDPGYELVEAVLEAGHTVSPIPGPNAAIAALVASGLPADNFLYMGYLPRKSSERLSLLRGVADLPYTLIFLETPHRLLAALKDIKEQLGDRNLAVARELTKLHEEIFRGNVSQAINHYKSNPAKGEITLVIAGKPRIKEVWSEEQLTTGIKEGVLTGTPPAELAGHLAAVSGWPRREIYKLIIEYGVRVENES
jgi:16S rRNA (cytidine1402-2'-O)-methyltransferase